MIEKVKSSIQKLGMIENGDNIVVGFSGGPDSTALMHVLVKLREEFNLKLYAAHLNHMIRGDEALRDEKFCEEFCEKFDIKFYKRRQDVTKISKELKLSCEEGGRLLRYEFFNEILSEIGGGKIALAHNMNDNAETILMRVFRGTASSGMGGIAPTRDNIIRPVIECTRCDIESYCEMENLNPVIDSTNLKDIYTRNKVRLKLIPYIRENFNPNIVENLSLTSKLSRDEEDMMLEIVNEKINSIKTKNAYSIEEFNKLHIAMKRRVLREVIKKVKKNLEGIEAKHIELCIDLIYRFSTGKSIDIKNGLICKVEYGEFSVENKKEKPPLKNDSETDLLVDLLNEENQNKSINLGEYIVNIERVQEPSPIKDRLYTKYIDLEKVKSAFVRRRKNGDIMSLNGMRGHKKLKDIFIDMKIPKHIRESIPMLLVDEKVILIPGIKDGAYLGEFKDQKILKITFEKGE